MQQGNQEHPQIFLARLREAADLANISNEAIIESRFRAGLLREIKQFCIQSSSRAFKDWTNHADGWWNANRPRKIAMVDNPFIPRNINNALIYNDDNVYNERHDVSNHNVEIVDTDERPTQMIPVNNTRIHGTYGPIPIANTVVNGTNQLSALEVTGYPNDQYYSYTSNKNHHSSPNSINSQQDICNMIQQAIRKELNQQSYNNGLNRNYNRHNRGSYNQNENYDGHNNGRYNNNYNSYNKFNNGNTNGYTNNGYNNRFNGRPDQNNYHKSGYGYQNNNSNYNQNQNQNYNFNHNQNPNNQYINNTNQNESQSKNNYKNPQNQEQQSKN
ncbi:hypothetical protein G6F56_012313 [Rhizopus delemar]|nr:hypothetical protein G6F56_012313 [Rhizopus delemar]